MNDLSRALMAWPRSNQGHQPSHLRQLCSAVSFLRYRLLPQTLPESLTTAEAQAAALWNNFAPEVSVSIEHSCALV